MKLFLFAGVGLVSLASAANLRVGNSQTDTNYPPAAPVGNQGAPCSACPTGKYRPGGYLSTPCLCVEIPPPGEAPGFVPPPPGEAPTDSEASASNWIDWLDRVSYPTTAPSELPASWYDCKYEGFRSCVDDSMCKPGKVAGRVTDCARSPVDNGQCSTAKATYCTCGVIVPRASSASASPSASPSATIPAAPRDCLNRVSYPTQIARCNCLAQTEAHRSDCLKAEEERDRDVCIKTTGDCHKTYLRSRGVWSSGVVTSCVYPYKVADGQGRNVVYPYMASTTQSIKAEEERKVAEAKAAAEKVIARKALSDLDLFYAKKSMSDAGISGGDGFISVGSWKLGTKSFTNSNYSGNTNYFVINHCYGLTGKKTTAQVFKSDGTVHPGPRTDFNLCNAPGSWDGKPTNVHSGNGYIEFAGVWRIGNIDNTHLSIAHKDIKTGITKTAMIWRKDGTRHPGPRTDYSPWSRSMGGQVRYGDKFLQFGSDDATRFRFTVFGSHSSIAYDTTTAVIYRGDGTIHGGPRHDWHSASKSSIRNLLF